MAIVNIRKALKIEIAITMPDGTVKAFREDDIINCVVSLRSDLSPIDPTLPESEIEADIYAADVVGASFEELPDETAITYRTGDKAWDYWYSPTRYFYMDEVSWENNILHIHARDQVHKLDEEIAPLYIGQKWESQASIATSRALQYLYMVFLDVIDGAPTVNGGGGAIIEHLTRELKPANYEGVAATGGKTSSLIERGTRREIIAKLMNLCRFEFPDDFLSGNITSFYLNYVDAGYPYLTWRKKTYTTSIYEEDCGEIKEERGENVRQYVFNIANIEQQSGEYVGSGGGHTPEIKSEGSSGTVKKQQWISIDFSGLLDRFWVGMTQNDQTVVPIWAKDLYESYIARSRPYTSEFGWTESWFSWLQENKYGMWLFDQDVNNNGFSNTQFDYIDLSGGRWNEKETSWYINGVEQTVAQMWQWFINNGQLAATATSASFDVHGIVFAVSDESTYKILVGEKGTVKNIDGLSWIGSMYAIKNNATTNRVQLLPQMGLDQIAKRPKTVGSFVHRTLPSRQPRDVIRFYFIEKILMSNDDEVLTTEDGTELQIGGFENRTIETITTTHENGGSISEFTYRRGII